MTPQLTDQIDQAANLARIQAKEFIKLAAAADDQHEAARLLGRAEALCNAVTDLCSLSMTDQTRRRALSRLLLHTTSAAGALDESQTQERSMQPAN